MAKQLRRTIHGRPALTKAWKLPNQQDTGPARPTSFFSPNRPNSLKRKNASQPKHDLESIRYVQRWSNEKPMQPSEVRHPKENKISPVNGSPNTENFVLSQFFWALTDSWFEYSKDPNFETPSFSKNYCGQEAMQTFRHQRHQDPSTCLLIVKISTPYGKIAVTQSSWPSLKHHKHHDSPMLPKRVDACERCGGENEECFYTSRTGTWAFGCGHASDAEPLFTSVASPKYIFNINT